MENYVGKRLDGRYELKEIVGIGGMAVVYKAYDNVEDRIVAVKILKDEYATNEDFLRRFKNESKAISLLSHPNIVKVYDVSFGDVIQYIVMEYIEGITLKEYIEKNGSLVWKTVVAIAVQILRALQHAHDRGIVHRDVKPQNIIILDNGTIKVTDFGIARFARTETQTITDKAIGSVHYMSPEQARGDATDEKADIYSVGVILYEMLTGKLPFEADSAVSVAIMQLQSKPKLPSEIDPTIPRGLEQIIMHAMQKDPERRYHSAAEMLKDLEEFKRNPEISFNYDIFVDDEPTRFVEIDDKNDELKKSKNKTPTIMILAGVAAAFVLAFIVLAVIFVPKLVNGSGGEVKCPNFVGMVYDDAFKKKYADWNFDVTTKSSAKYDVGQIMEQKPTAGRKIKKSQTVKITVSTGAKKVTVPDVYNMDEADAVKTLKNKGFDVTIITKEDDEIEKGLVIMTDPAHNTDVAEGSKIQVYVSLGKPVKYVNIPNLIGLDETAAKKRLEDEGLKVGTVNTVDTDEKPKGTVVSQSPESGAEVAKGTAVNIDVSSGKAKVTTKTYTVNFTLPADVTANGYVYALFDGSKCYDTNFTDKDAGSTFSFDVQSTKTSGEVVIKIRDTVSGEEHTFKTLTVDFEKGTSTSKSGTYPKKTVTSE